MEVKKILRGFFVCALIVVCCHFLAMFFLITLGLDPAQYVDYIVASDISCTVVAAGVTIGAM